MLFRCPNTGLLTQAWEDDDAAEDDNAYEMVTCHACQRVHFVNRKTGKVLGEGDE